MAELKWRNYPVPGMPDNITGNFGDQYGNYRHRGTDVGVVTGTPVYAPADGVAVDVFNPDRSFGNAVCLSHEGTGWFSLYAHLSEVLVVTGQRVVAGERIGSSGNTGTSTGPHLHWQVSSDRTMPVDIRLSRDAMKVPFEEEDVMTPEQERLLLLVASVVGGWTTGQEFTSVTEALPSFETFEGQDQRILMGMDILGESIEGVARVLQEHLDAGDATDTYVLLNEALVNVRANLANLVRTVAPP